MLCDRILGNIADAADRLSVIDWVEIGWNECSRRALRKRSRGGRELKILLPLGARLRHGDVLVKEVRGSVAVEVPPCEVLIIKPADWRTVATLALELGNLHAPCEIGAGELIVLADGPVEALLARSGIVHERALRRFAPLPVEVLPHLRLAEDFRVVRPST